MEILSDDKLAKNSVITCSQKVEFNEVLRALIKLGYTPYLGGTNLIICNKNSKIIHVSKNIVDTVDPENMIYSAEDFIKLVTVEKELEKPYDMNHLLERVESFKQYLKDVSEHFGKGIEVNFNIEVSSTYHGFKAVGENNLVIKD